MIIVDANVILRYLLNDDEILAEKAGKIIGLKNVATTIEVIAEVVYVLKKVYLVPEVAIKEAIAEILSEITVKEKAVVLCAIDIFAGENLDFVDCILYAYKKVKGCEVETFDKKLNKMLRMIDDMS